MHYACRLCRRSTTTFAPLTPQQQADLSAMSHHISARILLLLGGPGAGKGTCTRSLTQQGAWQAVSAGDLLRAAAPSDPSIATTLAAGNVVPAYVSASLVLRHLLARGSGRECSWVLDGFPRSLESAMVWEAVGGKVWRVLHLDVREDIMKERLAGRGREDDGDAVVVARRIAGHREEMPALKAFYEERGLWHSLDGNESAGDVVRRIKEWVKVQEKEDVHDSQPKP